MRCPDCSKFVGLETQEPEEQTAPEVTNNDNGTATVIAEYTIDRNCAECSNLLKQGSIELEVSEVQLDDTREGGDTDEKNGTHEGHDLELNDAETELVEDSEPKAKQVKDRKTGKMKTKYPNPRYVRSLFGVKLTGTIHCTTCKKDVASVEVQDVISASSFEEQV